MLDIFLEVSPTPKARPRLAKTGNVYTPRKTAQAERDIKFLLKEEVLAKRLPMTDKPVIVSIIFNYEYPARLNQADKLLADFDMLYRCKKPDLDNLCKLVMDSMNGIIYHDDSQVVKLICEKRYSREEGINLKVIEI